MSARKLPQHSHRQIVDSPLDLGADMSEVQSRLELEITPKHPLYGKRATAIGRRIDCDVVLVRISDGTFANVHLVWSSLGSEHHLGKYPSRFPYGSLDAFIEAMRKVA
jgi:hypothetical protein